MAVVDRHALVAGPVNCKRPSEVAAVLREHAPTVVGVDSPRSAASPGATSREGERALARAVCGIRWTPDAARVAAGDYYAWVRNGLELYRELGQSRGWEVIEVFPTASWTRWKGPRQGRPRSAWTGVALAELGLGGLPARRLNQDGRDAIAAAVTARMHAEGATEAFGDIVVPLGPPDTHPDVDDLLAEARAHLVRLSPAQTRDAVERGAILIDIRAESQRAEDGEVPGARFVPRNVLEWRLDPASPHRDPGCARRDLQLILMCDEGYQSSLAAATLTRFGLEVADVVGGFQAWREAGLPITGAS